VNIIQMMVDKKFNELNITEYLEAVGIAPTKATMPPSGEAAMPAGGALILAPPDLFNVSQYQPSTTCQLSNNDTSNSKNDTICCNNPAIGSNGTKFCGSLSVIGQEWVKDINGLCGNLSSNNMTCANASGNVLECVQNATWKWAVSLND
jgi:hypothetical protein